MITYKKGDATKPEGDEPKVIIHCCNNVGAWGAGFVLALSKRWPEPEHEYRSWFKDNHPIPFVLGNIQVTEVEEDLYVANMIGQNETLKTNSHPIDYEAIYACLTKVNDFIKMKGGTVHAPRFGAGLAGGKWEVIEALIEKVIEVPVTIYDFK